MRIAQRTRLSPVVLSLVISFGVALAPMRASAADATRDFITTCTYGALAGGLVGAATLAFSDDPGGKVGNVARGASLGLYAGIFLGLYMIYGNSGGEDDAAAAAAAGITKNDLQLDQVISSPAVEVSLPSAHAQLKSTTRRLLSDATLHSPGGLEFPSIALIPIVSVRGVDGASAQFRFTTF